ncbi:MAG: LysM peptidoglycan-binding domain-containing protein [Deltaproteobacteria bacterium]|nr:LysM peptidoglycan-binding domain-containing protein [Deltaproteobacteria bacterium]
MTSTIFKFILSAFLGILLVFFCLEASLAQEEEKTYDISLEKTAEIEKDIHKVDDKKVLTETLTIKKGEWVWKILREKGLLKQRNLAELLSVLKKLNKSFQTLDLVHPGEKIIIPLKIVPLAGGLAPEPSLPEKVIPVAALKDMNLENYSVKPGDSLSMLARGRYDIPSEDTYKEYLNLVKKLNPSIKDPNLIYPGQVIRLPIYSPQIVRKPIVSKVPKKLGIKSDDKAVSKSRKPGAVGHDLAMIFTEIGEEWVQTGRHFIPLKSGGQIDLEAKSFPIINLRNGLRVILDLNNKVPERMEKLIGSSWGNYRVAHIAADEDLRSALDKIIRICDYPKVFERGETLGLKGDIGLQIAGDWIIRLSQAGSDSEAKFVVINLTGKPEFQSSRIIKDYLKGLGVKVIDYPPGQGDMTEGTADAEMLSGGGNSLTLIKSLLDLSGRTFTTAVKIPVYQSQKADFKLIVTADIFLKVKGSDAIIALTDLGTEVISFLGEHRFSVLSLFGEKDPLAIVSKTLEFIGVPFDTGPHDFTAAKRDDSKNIRLSLPGNVFSDKDGKPVLVSPLSLPREIAIFLSQRGYRILVLSFS